MLLPITLLIVGIITICLEVFVPGGILGSVGVILILASTVLTHEISGMISASVVLGAGILFSILGVIFELKFLSKTTWGNKLFLKEQILSKSHYMEIPKEVIGKKAETITILAPTGKVRIDGKIYEAFSIDGFLEHSTTVEVAGQDNFRLLVKRVRKEQ